MLNRLLTFLTLRPAAFVPLGFGGFKPKTASETIAAINHNVSADPATTTGVANLYERDKDKVETGFAIVKTLGQNANAFFNLMAKDINERGNVQAQDAQGNLLFKKDANGINIPLTIAQATQITDKADPNFGKLDLTSEATTNYTTREKIWGNGGYGSIILSSIVGAASGNVTGSGSMLLRNTAITVARQYGATQIKHIADEFLDPNGNKTASSEIIRGVMHAISSCAGASATGGDCASAAAGAGGTVALNVAFEQLMGLDPKTMSPEQKLSYSNLMGTIVAGVTSAVGGDAAAAQLASKVEVENNRLLRSNETSLIKSKANGDAALEKRLTDAACYATKCWTQFPEGSDERSEYYVSVLEASSNEYQWVLAQQDKGFFLSSPTWYSPKTRTVIPPKKARIQK